MEIEIKYGEFITDVGEKFDKFMGPDQCLDLFENPAYLCRLGLAELKKKKSEKACNFFDRAISNDEDHATACIANYYKAIALIYQAIDKKTPELQDQAIHHVTKAKILVERVIEACKLVGQHHGGTPLYTQCVDKAKLWLTLQNQCEVLVQVAQT